MKRVVIYPKDVAILTGLSQRHCRLIIQRIKESLNKDKHQLISITEFCDYMGLNKEEVEKSIKL